MLDELIEAVNRSGFFAFPHSRNVGWMQVASRRRAEGGYTGNSFWICRWNSRWWMGCWGGDVFRVPPEYSARDVVLSLLRSTDKTVGRFVESVLEQDGMTPESDEEVDAMFAATVGKKGTPSAAGDCPT